MIFRQTIPCSRPEAAAWADNFGHTQGEVRAAVSFDAAFVPPTTQAGSQIVDGVLQQTTITKPTLFIDRRDSNAAALEPGAIVTGDPIVVDGEDGWQVDGDPAQFTNPFTGKEMPLVVELRRTAGG